MHLAVRSIRNLASSHNNSWNTVKNLAAVEYPLVTFRLILWVSLSYILLIELTTKALQPFATLHFLVIDVKNAATKGTIIIMTIGRISIKFTEIGLCPWIEQFQRFLT